jgi:hypothetical protein
LPGSPIDGVAEPDLFERARRVPALFVARHLGERRVDGKPHVLQCREPGKQ